MTDIPADSGIAEVTPERSHGFLATAGIRVAEPALNIGRELTYEAGPRRTLVVYIGQEVSDGQVQKILHAILSVRDNWHWFPRAGGLDLEFSGTSRSILLDRLWLHRNELNSLGADIYLVGGSGEVMIHYGHHSFAEGLAIYLTDVLLSSRVLVLLNELGAEIELYSNG